MSQARASRNPVPWRWGLSVAVAGLILTGCAALPEPDGMEAAIIARTEGLEALAPAEGSGARSVARNGLLLDPAVREAASLVSASADEVRVQRAALFPGLGLSVGGGVGSAGEGKAAAELQGSQLLFDGGNSKRSVKLADFDMQISYLTFQKEVDEALITVLQAYDDVQMKVDLLKVYRKQLDALGELETLVAARAKKGAVSSTDVLETRRRVQSAVFLVNDTELALAEARDRLALLSGQSTGGRIAISGASCNAGGESDNLRLARLELGRARMALEKAQNALDPRVVLQPIVRAEIGTGKVPVGLNLDIQSDLLKGGALSAKANAARNKMAAAQARLDSVGREDTLEERGLLRSIAAGDQKRDLLQRQISLLSQTRELYRSQYFDLGTRQLSELLDNEEEFYARKAELAELESQLAIDRMKCVARSRNLRKKLGLEGQSIYGYPLASDLI